MKLRGLITLSMVIVSSIMAISASSLNETIYAEELKMEMIEPTPLVIENNNTQETFANNEKRQNEEQMEQPIEEVVEIQQPQPDLSQYADILPTMNDTVINITSEIGPMYGIDPELLQAIIFYESSNNPSSSNGNCFGYMQIFYIWHQDRMDKFGVTDITDPYGNILVGTDYLSELIHQYNDLSLVLMIYNGDSRAYDLYNQGEMSGYANNILTLYQRLKEFKSIGGY